MPNGEVDYYCFLTKQTLEEARQPFYSDGDVADNLNDSLMLILDLADTNPRRRAEDKVFLSYSTNMTAIDLGYRGKQIDTPSDIESDGVEDEIIEMLDSIVQIEPAEVNGDKEISQVVAAAKRKHQDEVQDIAIVIPEEQKHEVKGELVKKQLYEEIEVVSPGEMHDEFCNDQECRVN